jgi:hypothetical protein
MRQQVGFSLHEAQALDVLFARKHNPKSKPRGRSQHTWLRPIRHHTKLDQFNCPFARSMVNADAFSQKSLQA